MPRPIGDRIATQADCLREAIRLQKRTKDLIPDTLLVTAAEPALEMIYDDIDNIVRKMTAALVPIDALLEEMEQGADEDETTDRYVLVGRE